MTSRKGIASTLQRRVFRLHGRSNTKAIHPPAQPYGFRAEPEPCNDRVNHLSGPLEKPHGQICRDQDRLHVPIRPDLLGFRGPKERLGTWTYERKFAILWTSPCGRPYLVAWPRP